MNKLLPAPRFVASLFLIVSCLAAGALHAQVPVFAKDFDADSIIIGNGTILTFTIDNSATGTETTDLAFTDNLPAGLQVAVFGVGTNNCLGGTLIAESESDVISYSGGSVAANSVCTLTVPIRAIALGPQDNVTGDLTSSEGNSGPAMDTITVFGPDLRTWDFVGTEDWFNSGNWTPNIIPNLNALALINNGGTARVTTDVDPEAQTLIIGVDGGSGTLLMDGDANGRIEVRGEVGVGLTLSGAATSTGMLQNGADVNGGLFGGPMIGPLRIGVTEADGDASGTVSHMNGFISSTADFSFVQIGVSSSAGTATGIFDSSTTTSGPLASESSLELGVAHADGDAVGELNALVDGFSTADVGVTNGSGNANGTANSGFRFEGAIDGIMQGPANIGVSNGTGTAIGTVNQLLDIFGGSPTVEDWLELNVGIANSTGTANGTLLNSNGIGVEIINVGLNPGGGSASGYVFVDHGLINALGLNLGVGSTIELKANSATRALSGTSSQVYSAIDVFTANLAGELILNLQYVQTDPITYEIVNSGSPMGINGLFDTVTVKNLPSGFSVNQVVQLDGDGNEQLLLDITGTPNLPEWINPNTGGSAGSWFDGANWSSGLVPVAGDPVIVDNGGEAVALASRGPGLIEGTNIAIGKDGNAGALTADGVDIEAAFGLVIGQVSPLISAEQTATGTVNLTDVDITVSGVVSVFPSVLEQYGVWVGSAQGSGTSVGSLIMNGGSITTHENVYVGAALPVATDADPTAQGAFTFNGSGIGVSFIETGTNDADPDDVVIAQTVDAETGPNASGEAMATANINNATILGDFLIADTRINNDNGVAQAQATSVVLTNLEITDDGDIARANVNGDDGRATSIATVELSNVTFSGPGSDIDYAVIQAAASGSVAISDTNITLTDVMFPSTDGSIDIARATAFGGGDASVEDISEWTRVSVNSTDEFDFGLCRAQGGGGSRSELDATLIVEDSELAFDEILFNTVVTDSDGVISCESNQTYSDTSINARIVEIGPVELFDTSQALMVSNLNLADSTMVASEYVFIGEVQGDGSNSSSLLDFELALTDSSLVTPELRVGILNDTAAILNAALTLNPSFVDTENLNLGEDGSIRFGIDGLNRIMLGNVGAPDSYAAMDAADALLDGEIIADFDFIPPPGTHVFDLIVTDSNTALDDTIATFTVFDLEPGFTVDFFGVVEDTTDVVRLQISGSSEVFFRGGFED